MRIISTSELTRNIKEMCIEANLHLSNDVKNQLLKSKDEESSVIGKQILGQLEKNLEIANEDNIPICQDTGMAIIFVKVGQEVRFEGQFITDAINEGIRQGYEEGYLRKSVVSDPIIRKNTNDNTPGIIHYDFVPGDKVEITVAPKGFGSENMSRVYMLKPSDGIEGIKAAVIETVKFAGPNACPPMVIGVGIGGSFEKCTILAKQALTEDLNTVPEDKHILQLKQDLLEEINKLGIGPGGLGGKTTALGLNIKTYPTHIAGMPLAINICCHVNRHIKREI